jgi:hypothetical protein
MRREIEKRSACATTELLAGCLMAVLIVVWHTRTAEPVQRGSRAVFSAAAPFRLQASTRSTISRAERNVKANAAVAIAAEPMFRPPLWIEAEYQSSADLYGFYLKHADAGASPRTEAMYFVSQALEECFAVSMLGWEQFSIALQAEGWTRELFVCQGFVDHPIRGEDIVDMLASAAEAGDPRARARMLLFRDIAAPIEETQDLVADLIATQDPYVMRDVEAFLGRSQSTLLADRHRAAGTDMEGDFTESPRSHLIVRPGAG